MPQELHVLRCFACKTFQVHIVKKVPKWQCKVCNEKQSVLKVYAKGSGKDCRHYVQNMNLQQGLLMSSEATVQEPVREELHDYENHEFSACFVHSEPRRSKWNEYLINEGEGSMDETEANTPDTETTKTLANSNIFSSRKRKLGHLSNGDYHDDTDLCEPDNFQLREGRRSADSHRHDFAIADQNYKLEQATHVIQNSKKPVSTLSNSTSKWSEFVSSQENLNSVKLSNESAHDFVEEDSGNVCFDWTSSTTSIGRERDAFSIKDRQMISSAKTVNIIHPSKHSKTHDVKSFKSFSKPTESRAHQNPFSLTDDENLDSLLEF